MKQYNAGDIVLVGCDDGFYRAVISDRPVSTPDGCYVVRCADENISFSDCVHGSKIFLWPDERARLVEYIKCKIIDLKHALEWYAIA